MWWNMGVRHVLENTNRELKVLFGIFCLILFKQIRNPQLFYRQITLAWCHKEIWHRGQIGETLGKHDIKNLHSDRVDFFWSEGAVCFVFFSQGLSVGLPLARSWIYRISTPEPGICFLNADNLFLGVVVFVDSWPNEEVDETCGERNEQTAWVTFSDWSLSTKGLNDVKKMHRHFDEASHTKTTNCCWVKCWRFCAFNIHKLQKSWNTKYASQVLIVLNKI